MRRKRGDERAYQYRVFDWKLSMSTDPEGGILVDEDCVFKELQGINVQKSYVGINVHNFYVE